MNVWAIADLHLSLARPDRRERYAARWRDHVASIEREWCKTVAEDDLVLIPGDISMARNHGDLQPDFAWNRSAPRHEGAVARQSRFLVERRREDPPDAPATPCSPWAATPWMPLGRSSAARAALRQLSDDPRPGNRPSPTRSLPPLMPPSPRPRPSASPAAALRALALPPLRPAPTAGPVRRPVRGRGGDRVRLRPLARDGSVVHRRARRDPGRPLRLRRRRRHRLPPLTHQRAPGVEGATGRSAIFPRGRFGRFDNADGQG